MALVAVTGVEEFLAAETGLAVRQGRQQFGNDKLRLLADQFIGVFQDLFFRIDFEQVERCLVRRQQGNLAQTAADASGWFRKWP